MSRALRAGVVGVGHLGQHHARLYSQLSGTELVGVVDTDPERAAGIASEYGAKVFDSVAALAREVDIASVATPTIHHASVAEQLIADDVALLVEKPIADDVAAGERMIELAKNKGVPLMVGHTERFHPAVRALVENLRRPQFLEIHRLAPFVPRSLDVDVVLDLMIHDIDLLRVIVGGKPVVRFDASGTAALTNHIDIASVRLRFEGGAAANLTASRISNDRQRRIRVFEPGSYLACDTADGTLQIFRVEKDGPMPRVVHENVDVPKEEPLAAELSAFSSAVSEGKPVPCSGEDGLAALSLALDIRNDIDAQLRALSEG